VILVTSLCKRKIVTSCENLIVLLNKYSFVNNVFPLSYLLFCVLSAVKNKPCLIYTREWGLLSSLGLVSALHHLWKISHNKSDGNNCAITPYGLVLFWVFIILGGLIGRLMFVLGNYGPLGLQEIFLKGLLSLMNSGLGISPHN
jgi:hypothetical protein